jgi:hypothetical protein
MERIEVQKVKTNKKITLKISNKKKRKRKKKKKKKKKRRVNIHKRKMKGIQRALCIA